MVSPEPGPEPDAGDRAALADGSIALPVAGSAGLAAVVTWFLGEAVRDRALATALDAPRWFEVAPFAGGVLAGLLVGARVRATAALVAIVLAALFAGALAAFADAPVVRLGLQSFALVALAAAWARTFAGVASLAAAALAASVSVLVAPPILAVGPVVAPSLAAAAALLATWFGARVAPVRDPAAPSSVLVAAAVVVAAWWSAPPSWWREGGGGGQAALHALFAAGALWAAFGGRRAIALLLGALAAFVPFVRPSGGVHDGADGAVLAAGRTLVASYDRATQAMRLTIDGEIVAESNAESPTAELAATLVHCLGAPGDRVLVLGSGAMRLPELLAQSDVHEVELADAGAVAVQAALAADGPVAPGPADATARVRRWSAGWPATLAALPAGSRQIVVVSESPTTRAAGFASVAAQHELRRVAGAGLVLQAIAVDHANPDRVRDLLAAAVAVHPWNGVFAVGGAAWLVGAGAPPDWPSEGEWSGTDDERRWIAHRAHLGGVGDLQRALLGVVRAESAVAGTGSGAATRTERPLVAVWREWLAPVPAPEAPETGSVLLQWIARSADVRAAVRTIASLGASAADQARAQTIAAGFLHVGAPAAYLQAALGLPDATGVPLLGAERAALCAHALDPTMFQALPPVFTDLPRPQAVRGDLEDLARLPVGERLVELCSAETPLAVALRARFPSQCARALVEALARGPLQPERVQALREIADPFVLAEAARVLVRRAALPELLAIWRADLPMPASLAASARGGLAERRVLAAALGGRRDAASWRTLVELLVAPEVEVRRAAAASLRASVGDGVAYDPEWSGSALIEAADRLRSLHNRKP